MAHDRVWLVEAPGVGRGAILTWKDRCVRASPNLSWAVGKSRLFLRLCFERWGWVVDYWGVRRHRDDEFSPWRGH